MCLAGTRPQGPQTHMGSPLSMYSHSSSSDSSENFTRVSSWKSDTCVSSWPSARGDLWVRALGRHMCPRVRATASGGAGRSFACKAHTGR